MVMNLAGRDLAWAAALVVLAYFGLPSIQKMLLTMISSLQLR
jgi:hypothetical protein